MLHHERLCPPVQGGVGVGHDFVARQCREVWEESRVDQRGIGEALKERHCKMRKCIHWELGRYWGGAERGLPVKWHDVRAQACAKGLMRVRRPSFEQPSGKTLKSASRTRVYVGKTLWYIGSHLKSSNGIHTHPLNLCNSILAKMDMLIMSDRGHFLNINSLNMILFGQLTPFGKLAFFEFCPSFLSPDAI